MPGEDTTVELFVRSLSPSGCGGRPGAVVDRLDELVEAGTVDDYSVCVWGNEVGLSTPVAGTDRGEAIVERVARLSRWAEERNATLPGFETREATWEVTGETYTALVLPVLAVAVYRGDDLRAVAPCRTADGAVHTVPDRLGTLAETAEGAHGPGDERLASP